MGFVAGSSGGSGRGSFDSTKMNMPCVRFGNAVRDAQRLVFISKEHDKTSGGIDSPGTSTSDSPHSWVQRWAVYHVSGGSGKTNFSNPPIDFGSSMEVIF
jgi:hypothetical protein